MADRYTLSKQGVERIRDISRRVGGGDTSSLPVATRRRTRAVCSTIKKILITSTISAASWNGTTNKLTPVSFTAKLLTLHTDDDGTYTYNTTAGSDEITAVSFYSTAITISIAGQARFGYVQNGELVIVDCTEITL